MTDADAVRAAQQAVWARLSTAWDTWDAVIKAQLAPVGAAMVESLRVGDAQHHLDVASGTGEPGLSVARLAPRGRVVLTDLSPEMLEVAARRAAADGLRNVETRVCSADDLPFEDATFDSVSVRFGLMFFPDLTRAAAEIVRVLRPGGRLCSSVWIEPERNPWTSLVMAAVASEVQLPPADPDGPSMYRCAAPGLVRALYADAGLTDVEEWEVGVELVVPSPETYWDVMSEHVSLVAASLRDCDPDARERIRDRAIAAVGRYERGGEVRVPGLARCVAGTRPGAGTTG